MRIFIPLFCLLVLASFAAEAQSPSPVPTPFSGLVTTLTSAPPSSPGATSPPSGSAPAANATNLVTFSESFADTSRIAEMEGVEILKGNATLSGRVANPGFEGDRGWTARASSGSNYTGSIQALWASEGLRSFRLSIPSGSVRTVGEWSEVAQTANFTGAQELRFDLRTSPQAAFHTFSVLAGSTVLWSKTFSSGSRVYYENESVRAPIAGLRGDLELRFRLESTANGSGNNTPEAGVEIDNVVLHPDAPRSVGRLTSTPVETASIVSVTSFANGTGDIRLEVSNDNGTTWEKGAWNAPTHFATAGRAFRHRLEMRVMETGVLNNITNTTTPAQMRPELYDVRFVLETSPTEFSLRFPRNATVGEEVRVLAEPDGLRYFFLVTAPNGLPLNLTRNATAFQFVPTLNGTYVVEVRATPLSGANATGGTTRRLSIEAVANATPPPAAKPPELEVGRSAAVVRVFSAPGAKDYPVEVQYWVESGVQKLSPGVVGGKVDGAIEFSIAMSSLKVGGGSYTFAVQVLTPDGAYTLKSPLTIPGPPPSLLVPAVGGGGAAAAGVFVYFFLRRRRAAAKAREGGALPEGAVEASLEGAAAGVLPSDVFVEPPPPFVGQTPTRLAQLAQAELPPPPTVQAEIPDWKPPPMPAGEPEAPPPPPGEDMAGLLQQREALNKEIKELEGYSLALGGAKSAEEARQVIEDRRQMRARLRSALDAIEARIQALKGAPGGAPAPVPAPAAAAPPPPSPAPPPRPPPDAPPSEPPAPAPPVETGFESPLQAEIDKIEAELKRKKQAK